MDPEIQKIPGKQFLCSFYNCPKQSEKWIKTSQLNLCALNTLFIISFASWDIFWSKMYFCLKVYLMSNRKKHIVAFLIHNHLGAYTCVQSSLACFSGWSSRSVGWTEDDRTLQMVLDFHTGLIRHLIISGPQSHEPWGTRLSSVQQPSDLTAWPLMSQKEREQTAGQSVSFWKWTVL